MKSLSIDIETYGSVDLTKSGVYAYANAPDFKILLFALFIALIVFVSLFGMMILTEYFSSPPKWNTQ